ncbi:MAG: UbiA family prenyltransferase [Bacteroidota bacterium]|nr:UbiA family prenyltransferase [Bacteroidota bacterium]
MEEEKTGKQSGVGVGALVTAIIAFLLAVIPCIGLVAVIPAVIAIVLAIIGLSRPQSNQGMLVGGLVVGIIALMISVSQSFVLGKIANKSGSWATDIEKVIKDVTDDLEKEFGDNEVTIRINSNNDSVEIKASTKRGDLEDRLQELEGAVDTLKAKGDTIGGQW